MHLHCFHVEFEFQNFDQKKRKHTFKNKNKYILKPGLQKLRFLPFFEKNLTILINQKRQIYFCNIFPKLD